MSQVESQQDKSWLIMRELGIPWWEVVKLSEADAAFLLGKAKDNEVTRLKEEEDFLNRKSKRLSEHERESELLAQALERERLEAQ